MGLWFSVYEEILTDPKIRHAAKILGTSQCEIVGALTFIWGWGLSNTDEDGKILHAGADDIADVIRLRIRREGNPDPEAVVNALIEAGFIDRNDGVFFIHNWAERQKYYHRFERKRAVDKIRHQAKAKDSNETDLQDGAERKPRNDLESKPAISNYSNEFEEFWKVYPRHEGKGECYKKYSARLKDGFRPEELKLAAENYAAKIRRDRTEKKFIKHGKTFLSDATPFLDYLPKNREVSEDIDPFADWR